MEKLTIFYKFTVWSTLEVSFNGNLLIYYITLINYTYKILILNYYNKNVPATLTIVPKEFLSKKLTIFHKCDVWFTLEDSFYNNILIYCINYIYKILILINYNENLFSISTQQIWNKRFEIKYLWIFSHNFIQTYRNPYLYSFETILCKSTVVQ